MDRKDAGQTLAKLENIRYKAQVQWSLVLSSEKAKAKAEKAYCTMHCGNVSYFVGLEKEVLCIEPLLLNSHCPLYH